MTLRSDREASLIFALFTLCVFLLGGVAGWIVRLMVKG